MRRRTCTPSPRGKSGCQGCCSIQPFLVMIPTVFCGMSRRIVVTYFLLTWRGHFGRMLAEFINENSNLNSSLLYMTDGDKFEGISPDTRSFRTFSCGEALRVFNCFTFHKCLGFDLLLSPFAFEEISVVCAG